MRAAAPLASHLPRCALHLALGVAPLALLLPAAVLHLAAELLAVALLLPLELFPVAQEVLDLAPEGGFVKACRGDGRGVLGGLDLLLHELHPLLGNGLVRALQPFLEVLLGDGQLGVAQVVIVRQGTDR
jgi:hypothetical protein